MMNDNPMARSTLAEVVGRIISPRERITAEGTGRRGISDEAWAAACAKGADEARAAGHTNSYERLKHAVRVRDSLVGIR